jgi:hypothetical protein
MRKIKVILFVLVLMLIILALLLPAYADYQPHTQIRKAISLGVQIRDILFESCKEKSEFKKEIYQNNLNNSLNVYADVVQEYKIDLLNKNKIQLTIKVKDLYWGAPWRQWQVAIPKDSNIVYEAYCSEASEPHAYEFNWYVVSTTVPAKFLPESYKIGK